MGATRRDSWRETLREKAERQREMHRPDLPSTPMDEAEGKRIVHELQVHQIELEIQNEELLQARAEVEDSRNLFRELYDHTPVGYATLDRHGMIRRINLAGAELLGFNRSGLTNRQFALFVPEGQRRSFRAFLEGVFTAGVKKSGELSLFGVGGAPRIAMVSAQPSPDGRECLLVLTDITDLQKTKEALIQNEALYRNLFENAFIGMFQYSPRDNRLLRVNGAYAAMLGYGSPEEMLSTVTDPLTQIHLNPRHGLENIAHAELRTWYFTEQPLLRKDGSTLIGKIAVRGVFNPDGTLEYTDGFVEDITESIAAEAARKRHLEEITDLYENAPCGYHSLGADGAILRMNATELGWLGYSGEEVIGRMNIVDLVAPEDRATFQKTFHTLKEQGRISREIRLRRRDGGTLPVVVQATAVFDDQGHFLMSRASVFDNREKKKAEEALMAREKELRLQAQNLRDVNTTMKVLLNTMEKDQEALKERILINIREQVIPYLDKLKNAPLPEIQKGYVRMAQTHLEAIASPFVQKLTTRYLNLTKKEIQIASLVRDGKTSKEIADILNASQRVIEFHRENIRKKLGLKNKKGSLEMLLRTLD